MTQTQEKVSPLRARMIEDMRIKGLGESAQKAHIRAVRYLAEFLGRSPDTATEEDLRAYQLHMVDTNVTPSIKSGLAAARARGKKLGRQPGQRPKSDKFAPQVIQAVADGRSYRWIARDFGISKNTVLEIMKRHRQTS